MDSKISLLFSKAAEYLISEQAQDGSWKNPRIKHNEPEVLHKEIVSTSEATVALNICASLDNKNAFDAINKGLLFCKKFNLNERDPVEWWSFKAQALKYSNLEKDIKDVAKIQNYIAKQNKKGFWPAFPSTSNLLSYIAISGLIGSSETKIIEKSAQWTLKNMAKDGKGWGFDEKTEEAVPTFTANVILSLVAGGTNPLDKKLQITRKFLESQQNKNGGWPNSKMTTTKPAIYATSLVCTSLMLLSENPFNSKIEKGIKFIVENSHKDGGWSLLPGEKEQELYVTYFALNALSFYQFLKKRYVDEDIVFLRKYTAPQVVATMLYKEFDHHLKKRFAKRSRHQILSSKALGSTQSAVNRRIAIIKILSKEGTKDVAEVIDSLKDIKEYSNINKKAYMTQIKLDLEYLRDANFVSKFGNTYYMFCDIE